MLKKIKHVLSFMLYNSLTKELEKSPLNMLLSDTHGFIYSVLHCIYTSLYTTGPFIEGSYCKSSLLRAMIGSGPLFLFCFFLNIFPDVLPNSLGSKWLTLPTETADQNASTQTHTPPILRREV